MKSVLLIIAICAPAIISLAAAVYFIVKWYLSQRGAKLSGTLLAGVLGPFAGLTKKAMTSPSRILFNNFLISSAVFIGYAALVAGFVAVVQRL